MRGRGGSLGGEAGGWQVCLPRFSSIAETFQQQGEDDSALRFPFAFHLL